MIPKNESNAVVIQGVTIPQFADVIFYVKPNGKLEGKHTDNNVTKEIDGVTNLGDVLFLN